MIEVLLPGYEYLFLRMFSFFIVFLVVFFLFLLLALEKPSRDSLHISINKMPSTWDDIVR